MSTQKNNKSTTGTLPKRSTGDINSKADKIFESNRFSSTGALPSVSGSLPKLENMDSKTSKRYYKDDDFIPKPDPNKKSPDFLDKGVKVGTAYVRRGRVYFWIFITLMILALAVTFLPPIMSSKTDETKVLFERNVFENKGMTDFKSYALANYSVYNEGAFSSEKSENYRVVELSVHIQNSSPFQVKIPQYKAIKVPKKHKDRLCYVTSTTVRETLGDSDPVTGDVVEPFGAKDVTIEIMVNVSDMTDSEFEDMITGLVIKTVDAKKRILPGIYIPCLPAILFVSDNSEISINP